MTVRHHILLCGFAALLAACGGGGGGLNGGGGGGGGGGGATNDTLTNLVADQTFSTTAGTISGSYNDSFQATGVSSAQSGIGSSVTVFYDLSADSYRVTINQGGVTANETFRPGDINNSLTTSSVTGYVRDDEQLLLFIPGNPVKTLSYVTYGAWQRTTSTSATSADFETTFFTMGIRTPTADMPTTGTATYDAVIDGYWTNANGLFVLEGSADIAADFGAGTLTSEFAMDGVRVEGNSAPNPMRMGFGTFDGTGTITGNTFGGTLAGSNAGNTYSGTWNGGFFGPAADEIGGSFRLTDGGDNQAIGAFVGDRP